MFRISFIGSTTTEEVDADSISDHLLTGWTVFHKGDAEVRREKSVTLSGVVRLADPTPAFPRPFHLVRDEDPTGISGTGVVAEGCAFSGDIAVVRWVTEWPTSSVLHERGMASVYHLHGHGGKTRIVWADDGAEYQPEPIVPQITRVPAEVIKSVKSARIMGVGIHPDGAPGTSIHLADVESETVPADGSSHRLHSTADLTAAIPNEIDGTSTLVELKEVAPGLVRGLQQLMSDYGPKGVADTVAQIRERMTAEQGDEITVCDSILGEPVDGA